ncbi:MAG: hypothetical protein MJ188_07875 [Treponema sp.]|nr:hypothetical protein [Treponema sp.]
MTSADFDALFAVHGDSGLTIQNIDGELLPEIGYHIRWDMQRKDYASEATSAVRTGKKFIEIKAFPVCDNFL